MAELQDPISKHGSLQDLIVRRFDRRQWTRVKMIAIVVLFCSVLVAVVIATILISTPRNVTSPFVGNVTSPFVEEAQFPLKTTPSTLTSLDKMWNGTWGNVSITEDEEEILDIIPDLF